MPLLGNFVCSTLSRPPHGGRGLKYEDFTVIDFLCEGGRPPHGGRGLKYLSRMFTSHHPRRPPHGGRGLKYKAVEIFLENHPVVLHTGDVD